MAGYSNGASYRSTFSPGVLSFFSPRITTGLMEHAGAMTPNIPPCKLMATSL